MKNRLEFMVKNNRRMNRYTCLRQMLCEEAYGSSAEENDNE